MIISGNFSGARNASRNGNPLRIQRSGAFRTRTSSAWSRRALLACAPAVLSALFPLAAFAANIREVNVRSLGIDVQNPEFILSQVSTKAGDKLDQSKISEDVQSLLALGRFSFVNAELTSEGDEYVLTFVVAVKPILGQAVEVLGADMMGQRRVSNWLGLKIGDPVDEAILAARVQKVIEEYNKRYYPNVKVFPSIEVNPATGFATVSIRIEEGERAALHRIEFEGNSYIPPNRFQRVLSGLTGIEPDPKPEASVSPNVLREAVKEQIWHMFSFITKRGRYDPSALEKSGNTFVTIYRDNGYLDAQVDEPEIIAYKPGRLKAVFRIQEGEQYRIGNISLAGVTLFPETNLWQLITLSPGDIASMGKIHATAAALQDYYQSRGYLRTMVTPRLSTQAAGSVVDVQFLVEEGSLVTIRYIDIKGNSVTKDHVIRRELLVYPGQTYDQVRVKRSERVLQNLGFFSSVTSFPRETTDPNQNDLVFEVTEQKTGQFLVGAGYSSVDDLVGFVELSQGNFDLTDWPYFTGAGQKMRFRAQLGTERQDYEISFVEPWFLGRKLSLGVDLYDTTREYLSDQYNEERLGGAITLGKPLRGFFRRVDLRYGLEKVTVFDVETNAIQRVRDEKGSEMVSSMKLSFTHDTRDNVFVPTRGRKIVVSSRLSGGPLGFDTDVYGFEIDATQYLRLWLNHVLSLRLWAAVVDEYGSTDDVPLFDRLYLGGARTLRGFKYRYVGPYEEDEPIGGKSGAMACAEYTIPIPALKIVRLAAFYEMGNIWLDAYDFDLANYCSDAGIGIRLDIPGFPVRLDYAWPIEISGDVEKTSARFNFLLGYGF